MTQVVKDWTTVTDGPGVASPLRAIEVWRSDEKDGIRYISAKLGVHGDDPNLRGHFPGLAVLPGVFVIEALEQALAVATGSSDEEPLALLRLTSVRFLAPLLDTDVLTLDITAQPHDDLPGGLAVRARGTRQDGTVTARIRAEFGPARIRAEFGPARIRAEAGPARNRAEAGTAKAVDDTAAGSRIEHVAIRTMLPQRHPLLLVDRVLDSVPGRSIRAIKAVTGTEPCFAALPERAEPWRYHYPNSLVIESFGQTAALLWLAGKPATLDDDLVLMFVGATDFRFEGVAEPGDVLRHEVTLDSVIADTAFASGETWIGSRRIATVSTLVATRRRLAPPGLPPRPDPLAGYSFSSIDTSLSFGKG